MAVIAEVAKRLGDYYGINQHAIIYGSKFIVLDGQVWDPKEIGSLFYLLKGWLDASDTTDDDGEAGLGNTTEAVPEA